MNGLDVAARGLARRALQSQETLVSDAGANLVGTSFGITSQQRFGETVSILEAVAPATHGAVLAGTNDDDHTSGVQALVDELSAAGGGTIEVPRSCRINLASLQPRSFVAFRGAAQKGYAVSWEGGLPVFQTAAADQWIIGGGTGQVTAFSVSGIKFFGDGRTFGQGAIYLPSLLRGAITNCSFDQFDEPAIRIDDADSCRFADNFALNCLLARTRTSQSGVIQISGSDNVLERGEYSPSLKSGAAGPDLYLAAVAVLGGGNNWLVDVVGEYGEVGFYIAGSYPHVRGCRADLNRGHGFRIATGGGSFLGNKGIRNGQGADDSYADFRVEGVFNTFYGNDGVSYTSDANRVRHVMQDTAGNVGQPNVYENIRGFGQRGPTFSVPSGSHARAHTGFFRAFTDGDTTPSVDNSDNWYWNNPAAPIAVTQFDDGLEGQTITVWTNAAQLTIRNNANIVNQNLADRVLIANRPYSYQKRFGIWYEMPHMHGVNSGGSDSNGDIDRTLTVGTRTTQRWTIPLTADRICILSDIGASEGDRFHLVRAAGGNYNLSVVNGGPQGGTLATLAQSGERCVVEFDGTDWFVSV